MSTPEHDENTPAHGAEGNASNDTALPFVPRKDDASPVGSTDQHSAVPSHSPDDKEPGTGQDPNSTD